MKTIKLFLFASLFMLIFSCDSSTPVADTELLQKIEALEKKVEALSLKIEEDQLRTVTTFKLINSNPFIEKLPIEDFFDTVDEIWDDVEDVGYDSCIKGCAKRKAAGKITNLSNCIKECTKNHSPFKTKPGGLSSSIK